MNLPALLFRQKQAKLKKKMDNLIKFPTTPPVTFGDLVLEPDTFGDLVLEPETFGDLVLD